MESNWRRQESGYCCIVLKPKGWRFDSEWKIIGGTVIGKVTKASYWNFTHAVALGHATSSKILHLDDQTVRFDDPGRIGWSRKH